MCRTAPEPHCAGTAWHPTHIAPDPHPPAPHLMCSTNTHTVMLHRSMRGGGGGGCHPKQKLQHVASGGFPPLPYFTTCPLPCLSVQSLHPCGFAELLSLPWNVIAHPHFLSGMGVNFNRPTGGRSRAP